MRRRGAYMLAAALGVGASVLPAATPRDARPAAAMRRAQALEARADATADPARRAELRETAVAARVAAAEADMAILQARAAAISAQRDIQRRQLAAREAPVARMLATLAALSRRPAVVALVQPGSVADLIHARAVLAATLPVLRARTAALRAELARGRVMQASAAQAEQRLRKGRARLVEAREQLAAVTGGDDDRALAMEEAVRDTAERLTAIGSEQAVLADVMALPIPPVPPADRGGEAAYRLPVRGRLVTGIGEMSGNGVRARGLTIAVPAAMPVVAPAGGRIRYAGPFRSFGRIVIVDHGAGWASLLTGLGSVSVSPGATVTAGAPLGAAPAVDGARVTVELRRRGRPVEITPLLG